MPRKPKIWFDYDYLSGLQDEDAPREVFFLSEPAQQVLSQLAEMVLWQTRWYNGDEADTTALAASIYEELKVPAHFDDLIPYVDEIEDLLKQLRAIGGCCGDGTTGLPEPVTITDDWPDTPPSTWAGETVADADDWRDLVCGASHAWVDAVKESLSYIDTLWQEGSVNIQAVISALGLLAVAGVLLQLPYAVALAVTTGLAAAAYQAILAPAATDIETARADIVCGILSGDPQDFSDAVENAVSSSAWLFWLKWYDYESIQATLVAGELPDGTPLTTVDRSQTCSCEVAYTFIHDVDPTDWATGTYHGWSQDGGVSIETSGASCSGDANVAITDGDDLYAYVPYAAQEESESFDHTTQDAYIVKVVVDTCSVGTQGTITVRYDDASEEQQTVTAPGQLVWYPSSGETKPVRDTVNTGDHAINFRSNAPSPGWRISRIQVFYRIDAE